MAATSTRNNILAGTFLLTAVGLAVIASFVLSDVGERLRSTNHYIVRFTIAQGAMGIKVGSPVLLGGQPVGKVSKVEIKAGEAVPGIEITVKVATEYKLYDNALFYLEKPLLGSLTTINIASLGNAQQVKADGMIGPSPELADGERIAGMIAPPSFLADAGVGSEQVLDLKQIISQAKTAVEKVNSLIDNNEALVTATLTDIRGAAGDARDSVKSFSTKVPGWTDRVDSILSSTDKATAGFPKLQESAQGLIDDGRSLVSDTRTLVADNRQGINNFVDNLDKTAGVIRENVEPISRQAKEAMSSFDELSKRLDTLLVTEGPNIRRTLANARLASDQLKLAILEIRAQPWRLLVQPDTKELQQQLLYDSARSYAAAVSDLRAASESLDASISHSKDTGADFGDVLARRKELDDAFAKYRQAEEKLFDQLEKSGR